MRQRTTKIILSLLVCTTWLHAQVKEINSRLSSGELEMTFPSIYFKNNSIEYAVMPYTVDSCFKYVTDHIKNLNNIVIWRDSSETEQLTIQRIKKLKAGLNNYTPAGKIIIQSMGKAQKISRRTINLGVNSGQIQYLLSLNSVFDVSGAINPNIKKKKGHLDRPVWYCPYCWKRVFQGYYKNKRKLSSSAR